VNSSLAPGERLLFQWVLESSLYWNLYTITRCAISKYPCIWNVNVWWINNTLMDAQPLLSFQAPPLTLIRTNSWCVHQISNLLFFMFFS